MGLHHTERLLMVLQPPPASAVYLNIVPFSPPWGVSCDSTTPMPLSEASVNRTDGYPGRERWNKNGTNK